MNDRLDDVCLLLALRAGRLVRRVIYIQYEAESKKPLDWHNLDAYNPVDDVTTPR